nr:hypothetical protein Iba_chr02eCG8680 [Ipomoea batatas]
MARLSLRQKNILILQLQMMDSLFNILIFLALALLVRRRIRRCATTKPAKTPDDEANDVDEGTTPVVQSPTNNGLETCERLLGILSSLWICGGDE